MSSTRRERNDGLLYLEEESSLSSSLDAPCGAKPLQAEITWDLVMSEDMPFAEGCFRVEAGPWQVVTAIRTNPRHPVGIHVGVSWTSGVTGINVVLPADVAVNATNVLARISEALGVTEWVEVTGPDSMMLR